MAKEKTTKTNKCSKEEYEKNIPKWAKEEFKKIHNNGRPTKYIRDYHCPLVIKVIREKKRVSAFCKEAKIGDTTFHRWREQNEEFELCYRYSLMCAREDWELQGEQGYYDPDFNFKVWEKQGNIWFGAGTSPKIRIAKGLNPLDQYKNICLQAENGEFTSSEFKQICEAVNIGLRAHEIIGLQEELNELKRLVEIMGKNNGENIFSIEGSQKTN